MKSVPRRIAAIACLAFLLVAAAASPLPAAEKAVLQGVEVEFSATPISGKGDPVEGEYAEVRFRITDGESGKPLSSLYPAAWMDLRPKAAGDNTADAMECRDKVRLYLQGTLGFRPLVDLNSYYILALNRDATISVIDPILGIGGITQLYAMIVLPSPGKDWAMSQDGKRLYVTMPRAGAVAAADTDTFKVTDKIDAGADPGRIVLQPDGRFLWVGNDAKDPGKSGVTVIERASLSVAAFLPAGPGPHDIAVSADSRYAFVTSREEGTLTVIDVGTLKKVKTIRTGALPSGVAYTSLGKAAYVPGEGDGSIAVVDGESLEVTARLSVKPGVRGIRFTPDGRFGLAVNPKEDEVYVIDAATRRLAHTIPAGRQPDQVAFSRTFAYVRSLGTERVSMIPLSALGQGGEIPVSSFPAGMAAPGGDPSRAPLAAAISPSAEEGAILVANPSDRNVYYYMEGMAAPMGSFLNTGREPLAVRVVDRSLKQTEPGVYAAGVRIPAGGEYDVAFLLDSPRTYHCFSFEAKASPDAAKKRKKGLSLEYLIGEKTVEAGGTTRLRFRLTDRETKTPVAGLQDVRVLSFLTPGLLRKSQVAAELGHGVYEAQIPTPRPGTYFVYVECPSLKVRMEQLPSLSLTARKQGLANGTSPKPPTSPP